MDSLPWAVPYQQISRPAEREANQSYGLTEYIAGA